MSIIIGVFRFLCVLCTVLMVCYSVFKFSLNEDMSTIEFDRFNGVGDHIYPTLSLCFNGHGIYNHKKIKKQIKNYKNSEDYRKFLQGKYWNEEYLQIDAGNITVDAEKLIKDIHLYSSTEQGSLIIYKWEEDDIFHEKHNKFPFHQSFTTARDKCYSFNINVETVPTLKTRDLIKIEITIGDYYGGVFSKQDYRFNLGIFLTYPNQLMRSFPIVDIKNLQRRKNKNIVTVMTQGVEVMQQRTKQTRPCTDDWLTDDIQIINQLISKVGCRLPQWNLSLIHI